MTADRGSCGRSSRGNGFAGLTMVVVSVLMRACLIMAASASSADQHLAADQHLGSRTLSAAGVTATDSSKIYVLYKVPPFEARLTFPDPGFQNHRGQTALMDIDESLDAITSRYLFDFVYRYMEGMSRQHGRPLGQRLHSLEVRADLYEVDDQGNILAGPNVDGRRHRGRKLRSDLPNDRRRRTSSFIPGAKPSSNADEYENLPPKYIVAEFTGTASFEDYRYDPADFDVVPAGTTADGSGINSEDDVVIDVDEATLRLMVGKALKQTNAYLQELRTSADHLVVSVMDADIRMDLDLALSDVVSGGAGNGDSDFYYGAPSNTAGGSSSSSGSGAPRPTSAAGGGYAASATRTSFPEPTKQGLSTKETATIAVMAFFLAAFVGFIYMYMSREHRHGGGHSGPSKRNGGGGGDGDGEHGTMNAALRRNHDGSLEFRDDWGADTVGATNSNNAYPVGSGAPPVSSRRYVNPDNGQVMYGASYTPSETEQVQAHYASQQRAVPARKKSKRNLTLVSPMMTVVEEEPPPPPPSRFGELPRSRNGHQLGSTVSNGQLNDSPSNAIMAALPQVSPSQVMKNVSSFFESMGVSPRSIADANNQASPTGVENLIPPVPFKDFPRNDGTPCVIFSDHSSGWEVSADAREAAEREALTAMSVEVGVSGVSERSSSSHNADEPIITDDGIEDFVEKLENLITLKSRQYKERVKMEQERAERKKGREERRRREREGSSNSPSKAVALSNPQAPSVGSPPSSKHGEKRKSPLLQEDAQPIQITP